MTGSWIKRSFSMSTTKRITAVGVVFISVFLVHQLGVLAAYQITLSQYQ